MNVAIVVAAGRGTRFGSDRPKQFVELHGLPIIIHTLRQFEHSQKIEKVVVVVATEETADFQSLATTFDLRKIARVVAGGETRARSVRNGLAEAGEADIIAVHDGVRPLVTPEEIDRVVEAASESGAAILTVPVADTIKAVRDSRVVRTLPRGLLRHAVTPQCFRFDILRRAYDQLPKVEAANIEVTDDSYLVERIGIKVTAVEGSSRNIKITNQDDLALAKAMLKSIVSSS